MHTSLINLSENEVQQSYLNQIDKNLVRKQTDDLADCLNLAAALRKAADQIELDIRDWVNRNDISYNDAEWDSLRLSAKYDWQLDHKL